MRKSNIFRKSFFGLALLTLAACTNEWDEAYTNQALREGEVSIQWLAPNMGIKHVQTRASDSKTGEEQQINNVHVFIFGQDGEYLSTGSNATQCYNYVSASQNLVLQTNSFADQDKAAQAIVVAVANVPENTFGEINAQGSPKEVGNLQDLKGFVYNYNPPVFTATLPEGGLPMMGIVGEDIVGDDEPGVDLSSDAPADKKVILIQMKSLMARIDLNFTMDPYQSSDDGRNPSLRIDEVRVGNFPVGGRIMPQLNNNTDVTDPDLVNTLVPPTPVTGLESFVGHILREGEPQELTLYMFEHGRAAKAFTYPETSTGPLPDEQKQRYKNKRAEEDAAFIELEGVYTNHNGYKYAVTYRIYPGGNTVDDFTIKSNCQYKNNITVKGITVNNEGKEALLDTRVNIDTEANPYFIEMLREREFDSHFNVTPMDVFIYKPGGKVTVEIVDPDAHKWIRMEPMKYSPTTTNRKAYATVAGEGKRKYFETDLVQGENGTDGQLSNAYNKFYEVSSPANASETYEERIYFYVDENVPTNRNQNGRDVDSREVTLKITYKDPDGWEWPREVVLRQAGMRAVYFDKYRSGQWIETTQSFYFYIEEYEEYLAHYDGKNEYRDTYEGFKWGLNGLHSGLGVQSGHSYNQYMKWGWQNTMQIMDRYRASNQWRGHEMTLNDEPSGAAEYCYNKNKRDKDGNVVEARWYLPTISELEYALEKYYINFEVFQDKWYWSSNPGAEANDQGGGDEGEDVHYARATRVKYDPDNNVDEPNEYGYVHYRSNPDYPYDYDTSTNPYKKGQGGHAPRDTEFRIRAAYIYEVPWDAPSVRED